MAIADTARLIASLELQDKFSRPAAGITRSLGGMERGFSQIGRGAGQVAGGLATLGTRAALVAAGGLTAVVTTAASFEQAFAGVEKTVGGTTAQLAELEAVFRQMARTIPVSFEELSAIGAAGGALGIARKDLADFTDVVARLSVSTNLSSEQAATALGQLGNVLHLSGEDFRDFADSLVALGNDGASTEAQIIDITARFGAAGNAAGLSKEDILALGSAVASVGIEAEAGGSALSRIFNSVATNIGTSSAKAEAFADTLGLSAAEFRRSWERDALGTFQDFLTELNKLDQFEQASVLKSVGLGNVRDVNTVRLMAQNVGLVADQLEVSRNATGALNKESQKFFDTTQNKWKVTVQNVKDVANTIGAELLPLVNDLTDEFVDFLQLDSTQSGIKTFAKDLAGGIRGLVTELKGTDFSGIIDGMKLAASVAKGAFDAFRSLPQPIQQLAIAALVANKVSGGAIGQIAGGLAGIVGGVVKIAFPKLDIFSRGSPLNPMFVSVLGGGLGGGVGAPAPVAAAKGGGLLGGVAKFVLGPLAAVAIGAEIAAAINESTIRPAADFEQEQFTAVLDSKDTNKLVAGLTAIERAQNDPRLLEQTALIASNIPFIGDALGGVGPKLEEQRQAIIAQLEAQGFTNEQIRALIEKQEQLRSQSSAFASSTASRWSAEQREAYAQLSETRGVANKTAALAQHVIAGSQATERGFQSTNAQLGSQGSTLRGILAKPSSFTANLTVPISTFINASLVQERIVQQRISMGHGFTEGLP